MSPTTATSSSPSSSNKKRKSVAGESTPSKKKKSDNAGKTTSNINSNGNKDGGDVDFTMLKLEDILGKIESLCHRVPPIPEGNFRIQKEEEKEEGNDTTTTTTTTTSATTTWDDIDETKTKEWAATLQAVLEEFNLYVCCVATATYKWGTDRSGAADQNLNLLSGEMAASQDQISSTVTPRLTNVLAPVVDLVIEKTTTVKGTNGVEVKENHFKRELVDPDFLSLCHKILARNAPLLRQVVLSNFHKLLQALKDYLKAQKNDTQHSRGFTY
jgi:hypothetical protein